MLKIVLSILAVVLLTLPVVGWWMAQNSLPRVDGIASVNSLLKEAAVSSDDRGVPYISASSELDLYRAQGYWAGSHRLFQMDMLRRLGRGELSQVFGSHCLPQDKLMRQIGFARVSKEEWKLLSDDAKKALDAYCQGVNEAIATGEGRRPLEFWMLGYYPANWLPEDSLIVMKYLQYVQEESWSLDDLRQRVLDKVGPEVASRLFEESFPAPASKTVGGDGRKLGLLPSLEDLPQLANLPPAARKCVQTLPGIGSNGWVVAGSGTDSGGALLALDRHSELTEPNLWYACTLSTGDFKVAGITIPGVPGIMYGRNGSISWGATAYKADTQDLFIEQFSPEFPNKYKTPDGWAAAREVVEEIPCKTALAPQNLQHKVFVTRHGPVLLNSEGGSNAVILAWSGTDISMPAFETFYRLNRISDWNQFRTVLKSYRGSPQTFLFCDKNGNIGLQIAGNIPERKESELTKRLRASLLLPGWTGTYDWTGRLEFDSMPYSYNPKEGYLVANMTNLPTCENMVTPYPVQRVNSVLSSYRSSGRRPGLPDMAVLQGDEYAPLSALVRETLAKNINKQEVIDQFQLNALQVLDQWDGYLRRQSASAAIYESFVRTTARRVLISKMGLPLATDYLRRWPRWTVQVEHILSQKSLEWLPPEERKFDTFVVTSFVQALRDLRSKDSKAELDLANLSWDQYHKVTFRHLLFDAQPDWEKAIGRMINIGPEGVGGDSDTVNAFNYDPCGQPGQFKCTVGPAERLLVDMSDSDKFYETQPLGQSGHLMSPNRADQLKSWLQAKPLPVSFSEEQSDRQQRHKVILTPQATP